ncbi:MAG: sulfatase, partial [Planctomycetota bacterium]
MADGTGAAPGQRRPNILILITDDQGYADLGAYDHAAEDIQTPNLDRIARDGLLCTQAYVSAPVCSPSRAGWNTGRYQQRWDPHASWGPGLPDHVRTLTEHLQAAGYATGKVGKNDYGTGYHRQDVREYPLHHGCDEFLGFSSHAHDYFLLSEEVAKATPDPHGHSAALGPLFLNHTRKSYPEGYTTEIFTNAAIDFIRRHRDHPFCLVLSYNSVHHLIHEVPDRYLRKHGVEAIPLYDPATMGRYGAYYNTYNQLDPISDRDMRRYYLANLHCLDDGVGRVLEALEELGLAEDTLIVYFADNGGSPLTGADNRPLRGSKYILFEGGIRVACAVRWPSRLPKGVVYPHRISTLDILPTCLEAAGVEPPADADLDGASFLGAMAGGEPAPSGQRPMCWQFQDQWAVRDGDWKLAKTHDYTSRQPTSQIVQGPEPGTGPALYRLAADPAEQRDVAEAHPEVVARLEAIYRAWRRRTLDEARGGRPGHQRKGS